MKVIIKAIQVMQIFKSIEKRNTEVGFEDQRNQKFER